MPNVSSISVRLRRTTIEETFVHALVTGEVMEAKADGSGYRLDAAKVMKMAVRMGLQSGASWRIESEPVVEPHPIQMPEPKLQ